ncbi:hypothetical protein CR513_12486, partial [Mucuna pruriens]
MKRMFLEKFFPASRTIVIRKEICGIRQHIGETLYGYWERLNKLCVTCPHHEISEQLLIQYFYEGLIMMDRCMVDATSGGALMDKTPSTSRNLISNMESNTQQFGARGAIASKVVNKTDPRVVLKPKIRFYIKTPQNQHRYQPPVPKYQAPPFRQQPQQPVQQHNSSSSLEDLVK